MLSLRALTSASWSELRPSRQYHKAENNRGSGWGRRRLEKKTRMGRDVLGVTRIMECSLPADEARSKDQEAVAACIVMSVEDYMHLLTQICPVDTCSHPLSARPCCLLIALLSAFHRSLRGHMLLCCEHGLFHALHVCLESVNGGDHSLSAAASCFECDGCYVTRQWRWSELVFSRGVHLFSDIADIERAFLTSSTCYISTY